LDYASADFSPFSLDLNCKEDFFFLADLTKWGQLKQASVKNNNNNNNKNKKHGE